MKPPKVSVGIPLYRSAPFLDSLLANCEALAAEDDIEIIVSDRHGFDNTIDTLQSAWGHDPRFRFIKATDEMNWVEHMNLLLDHARGEYFRWMPHDDLFPKGCLSPLVRRLDSDPGVVLAYAPTRRLEAGASRMEDCTVPSTHPARPGEPWTLRHSLDLFWVRTCDGAFKGLFRRRAVVDAGFAIRPTLDLINAERAWLFGVSLLGGLGEEPASGYFKRYHPASTHAQWRPRARHIASTTWTMCGYLRRSKLGMRAKVFGMAYQWAKLAQRLHRRYRTGRP